jgi:hypothetical protein
MKMAGQIQPPNIPGAKIRTMQADVGGAIVLGFGIATGVGVFLLAAYAISVLLKK